MNALITLYEIDIYINIIKYVSKFVNYSTKFGTIIGLYWLIHNRIVQKIKIVWNWKNSQHKETQDENKFTETGVFDCWNSSVYPREQGRNINMTIDKLR